MNTEKRCHRGCGIGRKAILRRRTNRCSDVRANTKVLSRQAQRAQAISWTTLTLAGELAYRRDLVPIRDTHDRRWRLYVLRAGKMYHAIVLNASSVAMTLNGGFYQTDLISSFRPIRE